MSDEPQIRKVRMTLGLGPGPHNSVIVDGVEMVRGKQGPGIQDVQVRFGKSTSYIPEVVLETIAGVELEIDGIVLHRVADEDFLQHAAGWLGGIDADELGKAVLESTGPNESPIEAFLRILRSMMLGEDPERR